jgi:predicted Zn-dependent peptidase
VKQSIFSHTFENGIVLVAEDMPWLKSAAFAIAAPGGCQSDPADKLGLANFTCEMVQRGSGDLNSRQCLEALEELGADCSASVSTTHTNYGGKMPARSICDVLSIYANILRRPHLPNDQVEDGRQVCFQEIRSLEDELSQLTMMELKRRHFPEPLGRSAYGTMESVAAITLADIREHVEKTYRPNGLIISVAGNIQWEPLRDHVEKIMGDWQPQPDDPITLVQAIGGVHHIPHDSNQTHIALAYPSVPYQHEDYFLARGIVGVLSDGMSSRLFTEVREKRGLCYTVFASLFCLKKLGCVVCYAGTSADRAQETLDVIVSELDRLGQGIGIDELNRLKVQIRSSLVMSQESSRARAAAIAGDWYHLGRVRTLDELNDRINALTVDQLDDYVRRSPARDFNLVTLGPQPLEAPFGVSASPA